MAIAMMLRKGYRLLRVQVVLLRQFPTYLPAETYAVFAWWQAKNHNRNGMRIR